MRHAAERQAGQPARRCSERGTVRYGTFPLLPSRRPIRCFQRISGTPLVRYCCVVCVPSPESAFLKHALSSQKHKDCIVSSLYSLVVRYRLQQSSLTLPVFTNWPRFRSSAPDRRVFVLKTLCNTIAIGKDCTELHCTALRWHGRTRPTRRDSISTDTSPAVQDRAPCTLSASPRLARCWHSTRTSEADSPIRGPAKEAYQPPATLYCPP
jgi:hypothetical protein